MSPATDTARTDLAEPSPPATGERPWWWSSQEAGSRTRVVIVTVFARSGYLLEDAPIEELADAVRRVHPGERVIDPQLAVAAGGPRIR